MLYVCLIDNATTYERHTQVMFYVKDLLSLCRRCWCGSCLDIESGMASTSNILITFLQTTQLAFTFIASSPLYHTRMLKWNEPIHFPFSPPLLFRSTSYKYPSRAVQGRPSPRFAAGCVAVSRKETNSCSNSLAEHA